MPEAPYLGAIVQTDQGIVQLIVVEKVREASLPSSLSGRGCGVGFEIRTVNIDRVNLKSESRWRLSMSGIERVAGGPDRAGPGLGGLATDLARGAAANEGTGAGRYGCIRALGCVQSESELQALIEEVVVSESWFFRDERPFQCFREYVRARWLNDPLRPPLRILSLACAGGEEPYSIAMTLHELGLPTDGFILMLLTSVPVDWQLPAAEFTRPMPSAVPTSASGAVLSASIRRATSSIPRFALQRKFYQASVLDPSLLEGSPPYDVMFCRNLLIYLEARARLRLYGIDRTAAGGRWSTVHRPCRPA